MVEKCKLGKDEECCCVGCAEECDQCTEHCNSPVTICTKSTELVRDLVLVKENGQV